MSHTHRRTHPVWLHKRCLHLAYWGQGGKHNWLTQMYTQLKVNLHACLHIPRDKEAERVISTTEEHWHSGKTGCLCIWETTILKVLWAVFKNTHLTVMHWLQISTQLGCVCFCEPVNRAVCLSSYTYLQRVKPVRVKPDKFIAVCCWVNAQCSLPYEASNKHCLICRWVKKETCTVLHAEQCICFLQTCISL